MSKNIISMEGRSRSGGAASKTASQEDLTSSAVSARDHVRLSNQLHRFVIDGLEVAPHDWVIAQLQEAIKAVELRRVFF